ncbi:MAG: hypothetical protein RIS47_710 [Bacteroidota bacterium]|jgi:putative ABC transport system permease protein
MFDSDLWKEIYMAMTKNKLRSFLTAFGVFWGIFMLIVMLGAGKGLENGVYDGMGDFSLNSAFMWTQPTSQAYKGFLKGRQYSFDNGDVEAIKRNVEGLDYFAPRLNSGWKSTSGIVRGDKSANFAVFGDYPEWNKIDPMTVILGRHLNASDIQEQRKVLVIGQRVRDEFFKPTESIIGETIRIQGVYFTIIGVVKSKKKGGEAENENSNIFMPFSTMQRTFNYGDKVGWFSFTSAKGHHITEIETQIIDIIKKRHTISPTDDRAVGHFNVEEQAQKMWGLFFGIATLTWIVGLGTLIAGVIGVSNIMLVIVRERTKEIGIQRALGATPWKIRGHIVMESVVLTSVAGYIGLLCGVSLIEGISMAMLKMNVDTGMFSSPGVDLKIAVMALLVLIASGALAGLIPAQRAVSIKPIDALRDE